MGYEDFVTSGTGDNIIAAINDAARRAMEAAAEVERCELELKAAQARHAHIVQSELPDLFEDAGIRSGWTTKDGLVLSLVEKPRGVPSVEQRPAAYKWLRDNGHGGVIKKSVTAELGRASEERVQEAEQALLDVGLAPSVNEVVHPATLASLVTELLAEGKPVDLQTLGVTIQREVKVKPAK
jgi:hypothetical protein